MSEEEQQTDTTQTDNKPAGYDPVDVKTASPEEIQERLDYLYSQVKDGKRTTAEYRKLSAAQSQAIEELQSNVGAVVNHLTDKSYGDKEKALLAARSAAREAGDQNAFDEAQDELDDLRIEKKLAAKASKSEKLQPKNEPTEADLDPDLVRYVNSWEKEKNDNGELVRPWTQANHPRFREADIEAKAVFQNPRYENMTMDQKLEEVDRRMGLNKSGAKQTVLGGGFTSSKKIGKVTLSPRQEQIAIRTKVAGSKASDSEHIERYRKQIENISKAKEAR